MQDSVLVSVVVPMYNEEQAIAGDLTTILDAMDGSGLPYEIIVVDDGSTDRSPEILKQLQADPRQGKRIQVIRHPYNRGTGAARTTGIKAARGEVIAMTDADGTYPNSEMPKMLSYILDQGFCQVIGARREEKGTMRWLRSPVKWSIRQLASYLMNIRIPDLNSGMRAFRRDLALNYLNILPTTHSWVSTITLAFLSDRHPVTWMPIDYFPRKGPSSFHPIADTYNYLTQVVRTVTYFNPLKVFLPMALLLFALGIGKGIFDLIVNLRLRESDMLLIIAGLIIGMMGLLADLIVQRSRH